MTPMARSPAGCAKPCVQAWHVMRQVVDRLAQNNANKYYPHVAFAGQREGRAKTRKAQILTRRTT